MLHPELCRVRVESYSRITPLQTCCRCSQIWMIQHICQFWRSSDRDGEASMIGIRHPWKLLPSSGCSRCHPRSFSLQLTATLPQTSCWKWSCSTPLRPSVARTRTRVISVSFSLRQVLLVGAIAFIDWTAATSQHYQPRPRTILCYCDCRISTS